MELARRVAETPEVQLLRTIPGAGLLTAATIWPKLGDPWRFRPPKQIARYVGLDPSGSGTGGDGPAPWGSAAAGSGPFRAQKPATVQRKLVGLQRRVRCQPPDGGGVRRETLRGWAEAVTGTALRSGENLQRAS